MPEATTSPRNLYALLVGIDSYESIRGLAGCVQDVTSMEAYLSSLSEFVPHIEKLTSPGSKMPTKENIIEGFKSHLSLAREGDVVIFYFAGHGVREETFIPAFQRVEADNCLATLVCYDSRVNSGPGMAGTTLADKELRYLLHHHTPHDKAHVLVITDCCHSGENTRSLLSGEDPEEGLSSRLARPKPIGKRSYDGFLFHEEIPIEKLEDHSLLLEEVLPTAKHIQMAACRDVEEAWEARRVDGTVGGYFTITLLDILSKAEQGVTYYELKQRTTNLMRSMKKRPQTPQIYTSGTDPNELYKNFLSGSQETPPTYCTVSYNQMEGWTINLGAIHGIPSNPAKEPKEIHVVDTEGNPFTAETLEVSPGYSKIKFKGSSPKKTDFQLKGKIEGIGTYPLPLFLEGEQVGMGSFLEIFQQRSEKGQNIALDLVQKEADAMYCVRALEGRYYLTYPFDDKPLIEPVWDYKPGFASEMYDYLMHISQWTFFNKLNNPRTGLHKGAPSGAGMYPVEIQIFQKLPDKTERQLDLSKERVEIELNLLNRFDLPYTEIRIQITNHSQEELYCTLIYMSMLFASYPSLFPSRGVWLGPGETIEAVDGDYIPLSHDKYLEFFNWDYAKDDIKLIASTEEFDPMMLYLKSLNPPPISPLRATDSRAWGLRDPGNDAPSKDWTTALIEIYSRRPNEGI
ncbi:MAG: caspase family protein [Bacteroidota bacterium]